MRQIQVSTEEVKECKKCHQPSSPETPIFRHHKGNDGLLAAYWKLLRGQYHKWMDCVPLCFECHCTIHFIYEPIVKRWMNHTPAGCANIRKKFIKTCDEWLAGNIPTPVVPDEFRQKFKESLLEWQSAKQETGSQPT